MNLHWTIGAAIVTFWLAYGINAQAPVTKEFTNVILKKGKSSVKCKVSVTYIPGSSSITVPNSKDIKSVCSGTKVGVYKGSVDLNPDFPCTVNFNTKVKKNVARAASSADVQCTTPLPPVVTTSRGAQPPPPPGPTTNCMCRLPLPGSRSEIPAYSTYGSDVMIKVKDLAGNLKSNLGPEVGRAMDGFLENDGLTGLLQPLFNKMAEDELRVNVSTGFVEYQDRNRWRPCVRPPNFGLTNLLPLILIPLLAAALPSIIAAIINALTGRRMIDPENAVRVEAFLRSVETEEIFDEHEFFQVSDRCSTCFPPSFLAPIIAVALGFLLGQLLRTLLGLNRNAPLEMPKEGEAYYRTIAFINAVERSEFFDDKLFPAQDRTLGPSVLGLLALTALQPILNIVISMFLGLFQQNRSLNPELDTPSMRRLESVLRKMEEKYFPMSEEERKSMERALFPFPFPPPPPTTGGSSLNLNLILGLLGLNGSGSALRDQILNLLGGLSMFKNPVGQGILQNARLNMTPDAAASTMADIMDSYLASNGQTIFDQLQTSKTMAENFSNSQGPAIMQQAKGAASELAGMAKNVVGNFLQTQGINVDNGFPLSCTCQN